ncbi:hydrogenase-3 nickel incorporation protein HypA [Thermovibrio guaymasensis]|uniref:Hydrogenase maturation factor HypA n=1 Tax=Thermovibrio guaymasensis TaxID=240167 RepID=A0A420W9K4_9BACT|nr:hydrogenase maturation nickel metallochaperone HypA [Thermovibrio guaymasensis]RKQ64000.1 hydrogenase-3 nickel incorporation protein HypA [Thermovibrio guaymasensis]
MHETSIAMGLLNSLEELAEREKAKRVVKVKVKIGKLSGIVVDSFVFAFNALKEQSQKLKETELVVEEVPITYRCKDCNHTFQTESVFFPECPKCGSLKLELISGEELEVVNAELEV